MQKPSATALTLTEWARRLDPNGSTSSLVQALNLANPVLASSEMSTIYRIECIRLADDVDWCVKNGWRF